MNSTIELSIACDRLGEPFKHYWSFCVGAGRALTARSEGYTIGPSYVLQADVNPANIVALFEEAKSYLYCKFTQVMLD